MKLSTFGPYYLPPVKMGTLAVNGAMVDATNAADEEDGRMPLMGTGSMPLDECTISATLMFTVSFLGNPIPGSSSKYTADRGGLDAARFDLAQQVLAGGIQTLTFVPDPGTTPTVGIYSGSGGSSGTITSWTMDAQASGQWTVTPSPNGERVYAEFDIQFLIASGLYTVNFSGGSSVELPVH